MCFPPGEFRVCVCVRACVRACVHACVCVCARARACVCIPAVVDVVDCMFALTIIALLVLSFDYLLSLAPWCV